MDDFLKKMKKKDRKRLKKRIMEEVDYYLGYWDKLTPKEINLLLAGEADAFFGELWERFSEAINDTELDHTLEVVKDFDDELRVAWRRYWGSEKGYAPVEAVWAARDRGWYPTVNVEYNRLIRNTSAFVALILEPDYQSFYYGGDCYDYLEGILELLQVNPASLNEHYNFDEPLPDIPERDNPSVDPHDFIECCLNTPHSGVWAIMTGQRNLPELAEVAKSMKEGVVVKKGARIIPHDYFRGASGLNFRLTRDLFIPGEMLHSLRNDGDYRYGIQACCGMVNDAWEAGIGLYVSEFAGEIHPGVKEEG